MTTIELCTDKNLAGITTAILLSGQPRDVVETWPSFLEFCLPSFPNPDVYVYSSEEYPISIDFKRRLVEPQFRHLDIEEKINSNPNYRPLNYLDSYIQQIYGMKRVWGLMAGKKYDLIVRARPDLFYLKPIVYDEKQVIRNGMEFAVGPMKDIEPFFKLYDLIMSKKIEVPFDTEQIADVFVDSVSMENPYDYYRIISLQKKGIYDALETPPKVEKLMPAAVFSKMKTAVLVSGQPREVADTWRSFVSNLLDYLPNPDVYIYSSKNYPVKQEFFDIVNPKKYLIEHQFRHFEIEKVLRKIGYYDENHMNSYVQQIYGLKKVWELKEGDYDLVVRVRPDLIFLRPITMGMFDLNNISTLHTEKKLICW